MGNILDDQIVRIRNFTKYFVSIYSDMYFLLIISSYYFARFVIIDHVKDDVSMYRRDSNNRYSDDIESTICRHKFSCITFYSLFKY